jgi:hypothetical protein
LSTKPVFTRGVFEQETTQTNGGGLKKNQQQQLVQRFADIQAALKQLSGFVESMNAAIAHQGATITRHAEGYLTAVTQLEIEVEQLKAKVAALEARP